MATDRPRIGISSCLLGDRVRYNGGHKRDRFIAEVLSRYFVFVPYCPEVAIGLGVPRPTIRLRYAASGPRAIVSNPAQSDVTDALADYGRHVAHHNAGSISGYVFKSASPSCGMEGIGICDQDGSGVSRGSGIYARAVRETLPLLPVEDEIRLHDATLGDSFLERVLVFHRWQSLPADSMTPTLLKAFHAEHRFIIMAHSRERAQALDCRLARTDIGTDIGIEAGDYIHDVMDALSAPLERGARADAFLHHFDCLQHSLDHDALRELARSVSRYRQGKLPVTVPLTLLRQQLSRQPEV